TACNTQATEAMSVLTQSPKVLAARKAVMEFLLINHPVDCPICDQAGECWLQDYYMTHDLQASRFDARKEHDRKREIFGPNVVFDGERCIKCTRCVRSEEHTSELQSRFDLVCRLLLEKKKGRGVSYESDRRGRRAIIDQH